ncbi:MAG: 3-deoxy-manno-octulosonate cytidylyltransferase [Phycisphaerales bacterium]
MAETVAIIPARYASTRFPGKPLADRTGRPLIQHVHDRAAAASRVDRVLVATDDRRIADAVRKFGGTAVMTRDDHPNGTSRLAEVAAQLDEAGVVVNVQGDEPEIDPDHIDAAIEALESADDRVVTATLAASFVDDEDPSDPNIVKVVTDQRNRALYFSRSLIPFDRDRSGAAPLLKHIGLYVYRRPFLLEYVELSETPLEIAERLEQLRILEHGHAIAVATVNARHHGIDTPAQYDAFVKRWNAQSR